MMDRSRLPALAAVALVAACWLALPAAANDSTVTYGCASSPPPSPVPSPAPTPDPRSCTPDSFASNKQNAVDGTWNITFTAGATAPSSRLRRVRLFIRSEDPNGVSFGQPSAADPVIIYGDKPPSSPDGRNYASDDWTSYTNAPTSATRSYSWDTTHLRPNGPIAANGFYAICTEALSQTVQGPEASPTPCPSPPTANATSRTHIAIDNAPATPAKPTVTTSTSSGVLVDWSANPEPDLISYTLYRAKTTSSSDPPREDGFTKLRVFAPDTRSTFDEISAEGAYWYKVQATRASVVTPSQGRASALSATSARAGVIVPPPPTPVPSSYVYVATPTPVPRAAVKAPIKVVKPPPVPDAPFSTVLPYGNVDPEQPQALPQPLASEPVPASGRGAVLPVAVGAFLVSAALALGRMPAP